MKLFINIILALALATMIHAAFERFWFEGELIQKDSPSKGITCADWVLNYHFIDEDGDHYGWFPFDTCFMNTGLTMNDGGHTIQLNAETYVATLTEVSSGFSMDAQIKWDAQESDGGSSTSYCFFGEGPDVSTSPPWTPDCDFVPNVKMASTLPGVVMESPLPSVTMESPLPDVTTDSPLPDVTTESPLPDVTMESPLPDVTMESPLPGVVMASTLPGVVMTTTLPGVVMVSTVF